MRESNIIAAKAVADAVRTSLGPRGMDKMISSPNGDVIITNDGATILKMMEVAHPTAKMLVDLSKSQDVEAGDGTTTVTVIAGALLNQAEILLRKGIHPTVISESFLLAAKKSEEILKGMSIPVDLMDREQLIKAAATSLNSKVISNNSSLLAPLAVDALRGPTRRAWPAPNRRHGLCRSRKSYAPPPRAYPRRASSPHGARSLSRSHAPEKPDSRTARPPHERPPRKRGGGVPPPMPRPLAPGSP